MKQITAAGPDRPPLQLVRVGGHFELTNERGWHGRTASASDIRSAGKMPQDDDVSGWRLWELGGGSDNFVRGDAAETTEPVLSQGRP